MEIVTSFSKPELEQLITDSVQKCLKNILKPPQPEIPDLIDIDEAVKVTGYLKATIYKKSFLGEIPCSRRGKRLIFSRRQLLKWMESQTVPKPSPEDIAVNRLAKEAIKKEKGR
jgi:predicted DNA-binding transcriptional regulator AlpA